MLTDRQRSVLTALVRAVDHTATTPEVAHAAGLDDDTARRALKTLAGKELAVEVGTGPANAKGSKPPTVWRATPVAVIAVVPDATPAAAVLPLPVAIPEDPAHRLLRQALPGGADSPVGGAEGAVGGTNAPEEAGGA